ncbi:MAG: 2Fe-2S iron-sulfur cluster-binding protein [Burkholderiaceae bacterium]
MSAGEKALDAHSSMLRLRLEARRDLTEGIAEFTLVSADGQDLPGFTPGAHLTIETPSGAMRRYSLIGDPGQTNFYVIAVKHEVYGRGGSASLHLEAGVGDEFWVEAPINEFELIEAPGYLLIAGGIGITPILSMVRELERSGRTDYHLLYCTRDADQTAFLQELQSPDRLGQITIHHDAGDPDQIYDFWPLLEEPTEAHIYCCGPAALMEEVRDMSGHWPMEAVHFESFAPLQVLRDDDRAFSVRVDGGPSIEVPADKTILESLRAHGLALRSSCESGSCGTCKMSLLSGEVDHRDLCLTDEERRSHLMICVSRAVNGELVLGS